MGTVLQFRHPECGEHEVFVCNSDEHGYPTIVYAGKRRGTLALDLGDRGKPVAQNPLPQYRLFPVFAPKEIVQAFRRSLYGMDKQQLVSI